MRPGYHPSVEPHLSEDDRVAASANGEGDVLSDVLIKITVKKKKLSRSSGWVFL